MTAAFDLFVRDRDLQTVAQIDDFTKANFVLRFNRPGSWRVEGLPADGPTAALFTGGAGLIVRRNGTTLMSGPLDWYNRQWADENGEADHLHVEGPDDLIHLWDRQAHPSPGDLDFSSDVADVRTGVCSTVLRQYVDVNAGPSAASERRIAGLTIGADPLAGASVTGRARLQLVGDLLGELALAGGDIGFRVVQDGDELEFQVYDPDDLSDAVMFSPELGNLRSFKYDVKAPVANYLYVAGGGEGTARVVVEGGDGAAIATWGRRIERLIDQRQTTVEAELAQKREEELASTASRVSLELKPIDTERLTFGSDYNLGDLVTAVVDGVAIEMMIREVRIELTGDGDEVITPILATPNTTTPDLALFERTRLLGGRLTTIERI